MNRLLVAQPQLDGALLPAAFPKCLTSMCPPSASKRVSALLRQDLVDVQRAREADVRHAKRQRGEQRLLAVAHGGIAADMRLDLRLAPALRGENGKRQQLAQLRRELFLGVDLAVDEPLLDGGKLGVGDAQRASLLPVQRLYGLFRFLILLMMFPPIVQRTAAASDARSRNSRMVLT